MACKVPSVVSVAWSSSDRTHDQEKQVEEESNGVAQWTPAPKAPFAILELLRSDQQAAQADQGVRANRGWVESAVRLAQWTYLWHPR